MGGAEEEEDQLEGGCRTGANAGRAEVEVAKRKEDKLYTLSINVALLLDLAFV